MIEARKKSEKKSSRVFWASPRLYKQLSFLNVSQWLLLEKIRAMILLFIRGVGGLKICVFCIITLLSYIEQMNYQDTEKKVGKFKRCH